MAFKTKAEIFGDGTAGNPAVPIDTNAPPGHNILNRGTAFGEQVTAAIKNRTAAALADNDEDLNTRLADFEVRGIDGAYDLGTVGPSGGGRVVTKDGGAIETRSSLGADYADDVTNAHFRADATADTVKGSVGLDMKATANGAFAAVLDRRELALSTTNTTTVVGEAVSLNPGGILPTTIVSAGNTWHASGDTDLAIGLDLVEISGSISDDGLYVVGLMGASNDRLTVSALSGAAPAFTAGDTATVTFFRVYYRPTSSGLMAQGYPGTAAALNAYSGRALGVDDEGEGADAAFAVWVRGIDGASVIGSQITYDGCLERTLVRSELAVEDRNGPLMGAPLTRRDTVSGAGWETTHVVGKLTGGASGDIVRYDYMSLLPVQDGGLAWATNITFIAGSPTFGRVDGALVTSGGTWREAITPQGMVVQLSGNVTTEVNGYYLLYAIEEAAADEFTLRNMDGTVPAHLPTSGTAVCRMYTFQRLGRGPLITIDGVESPADAAWDLMRVGASFTAPDELGGGALALHARAGTGRTLLRGFGEENGSAIPNENVRIESSGKIRTASDVVVGGDYVYGDSGGRSRTIMLPLCASTDGSIAGGSTGWHIVRTGAPNYELRSVIVSAIRIWPMSEHLPSGAVITQVRAKVQSNFAATRTGSNRIELSITEQDPVMGTAAAAPTGTVLSSTFEDGLTALGTNFIIDTGVISVTVNNTDTDETNLEITAGAGATFDRILGVEVTYNDFGPRNMGE